MNDEQVQVVIHRTEPEPPTVDIETGISASGKDFFTIKVRNATTHDEAVMMAMAARYEYDRLMERDRQALDELATIIGGLDEYELSPSQIEQIIGIVCHVRGVRLPDEGVEF